MNQKKKILYWQHCDCSILFKTKIQVAPSQMTFQLQSSNPSDTSKKNYIFLVNQCFQNELLISLIWFNKYHWFVCSIILNTNYNHFSNFTELKNN